MRGPLLVLAGFAIATTLIAWSRWLSRRRWAAAGNLTLSIVATALVATAWPIVRHLDTYEVVHSGQPIASLYVEKIGSHRQRVTLTRLPSGQIQVLELSGEEWRLVVHELGWAPAATSLGFKRRYRFESLDARGPSASEPPARVVVALSAARGFDLWSAAALGSIWSAVAQPTELTSGWEPLADRERFSIFLEGAGLAVERREAATAAGSTRR